MRKTCQDKLGFRTGEDNVLYKTLVYPREVLFPLFYTNHGLMKQFLKTLYQNGDNFRYFQVESFSFILRKLRLVCLKKQNFGGYCRTSRFWRRCLLLKKKFRMFLLRLSLGYRVSSNFMNSYKHSKQVFVH